MMSGLSSKASNERLSFIMQEVNAYAFSLLGDRVLTGPFKGMLVPELAPWDDGNSSTKLLGSYEHELHASIRTAVSRNPSFIVNVGCAEGYYAIGMAKLCPNAFVLGLDIGPRSQATLEQYASLNEVNVEFRIGVHHPEELRFPDVSGHRLYIIDCEGDEGHLLDPVRCPEFVHSDVIVECHDSMRPLISKTLSERLAATHDVDFIVPTLPDFDQYGLEPRSSVLVMLMLIEKRPMPTYWLACWAKSYNDSQLRS